MRFLTAIAFAAALTAATSSFAQTDKAPRVDNQNKLPPWIVNCSNGNAEGAFRCAMTQNLQLSSTGQRILTLTIERRNSQTIATMLLPHGIDFTKGVRYAVDGGSVREAPVTHADQNGSYTTFEVEPDLLEAMKKGSVIRVTTTPVIGSDLVIELTLSGFSSSYSLLERNQ